MLKPIVIAVIFLSVILVGGAYFYPNISGQNSSEVADSTLSAELSELEMVELDEPMGNDYDLSNIEDEEDKDVTTQMTDVEDASLDDLDFGMDDLDLGDFTF